MVPVFRRIWRTEELHFHLFKLTGTKEKVAWGDLVAKRRTHRSNSKGKLSSHARHNLLEGHNTTLSSFRPQIGSENLAKALLLESSLSLQLLSFRLGEFLLLVLVVVVVVVVVLAALGVVSVWIRRRRCLLPSGRLKRRGSELGLEHLVTELTQMSCRAPHFGMTDDARFYRFDIDARVHKRTPPEVLQVTLESNSQRTIVFGACQSAVDL
mmetsp:Transcript_48210/g.121331  ORF Transcript_48210/g.121331 Transcript_48210/m.121331 type:complete len:211 (+) Transcript_48210:742-1374(+)